ncbi:MAG: hypothetical protein NVS4B6_28990 [Mycobacterium sp.]
MSELEDVIFVNADKITRLQPVFDAGAHIWTLRSQIGEGHRARVLIATDGAVPEGSGSEVLGLEPYLGVAVHGLPNYFLITGKDVAAQKSYIAKCLHVMAETRSTRIEVRYSTQRCFTEKRSGRPGRINWRRVARHIRRAFDLSSQIAGEDDMYDGRATVHICEGAHDVHLRLTGHFEPLDGEYHWQGTILEQLPGVDRLPQRAAVTIDNLSAAARITERTSQGGYSVVGVGAPPFALEAVEVAVPVW